MADVWSFNTISKQFAWQFGNTGDTGLEDPTWNLRTVVVRALFQTWVSCISSQNSTNSFGARQTMPSVFDSARNQLVFFGAWTAVSAGAQLSTLACRWLDWAVSPG